MGGSAAGGITTGPQYDLANNWGQLATETVSTDERSWVYPNKEDVFVFNEHTTHDDMAIEVLKSIGHEDAEFMGIGSFDRHAQAALKEGFIRVSGSLGEGQGAHNANIEVWDLEKQFKDIQSLFDNDVLSYFPGSTLTLLDVEHLAILETIPDEFLALKGVTFSTNPHGTFREWVKRGFWSDVITFFSNLFSSFGQAAETEDVTEEWVLGGGGKSGEHCPKCIEFSEMGEMPLGFFPQPRTETTYCTENCTCDIIYSDGTDHSNLARYDDWAAWEAANEGSVLGG